MSDYYKQTIKGFDLSLEKDTDSVPSDGKFHIVYKRQIVFTSKSIDDVRDKFNKMLSGLGYDPKKLKKIKVNNFKELVEKEKDARFFSSYNQYWDKSSMFKKGGRLGKR